MKKFKKSQVLMLSLLAALLSIAPLLSSSLRPTYLYLVLNFLIISLGAEAGLFSVFSRPIEDSRKLSKPVPTKEPSSLEPDGKKVKASNLECKEKKSKVVAKSLWEKIPATVNAEKVTKSPSMPCLFFVGGGEADAEDVVEEYEEEEDEVGRQELFAKAESFIGNFHKQLKMQREESWQRIHGFSQKAY